jgi:glycosyltransferase involved in cell wall biosynthesis
MRVVILSASNPNKTSGIIVKDLMKSLESIPGVEVQALVKVWDKYEEKNIITADSNFSYWRKRLVSYVTRMWTRYLKSQKIIRLNSKYAFHDPDLKKQFYTSRELSNRLKIIPDVIIVAFPQNFVNLKNIFDLKRRFGARILLYPMDMAMFTGGCHYAWDCEGYLKGCSNCPSTNSNYLKHQIESNHQYKKILLQKIKPEIIACSEELHYQISKSSLLKDYRIYKMFLPIDEKFYQPGDGSDFKRKYGIDEKDRVILLGAVSVSNERKGFLQLKQALIILSESVKENIVLLVIGEVEEKILNQLPFPVIKTGYLNYKELAEAYRASYLFASSSIQDSGPMMVNQAIMSGLPVVSFDVGVAKDLVLNGETGYKAKYMDVQEFAKGLYELLSLDTISYEQYKCNCRALALKLTSYKAGIKKYQELFNSMGLENYN